MMLNYFQLITRAAPSQISFIANSDAHVHTNPGRLVTAINDLDGMEWDFWINAGDLLTEEPMSESSAIAGALELNNFSIHKVSDVYSIMGNYDGGTYQSDPLGEDYYFKKYIDPIGENPATSNIINSERPFQVTGTYNAYSFDVGNMHIIMLGDREGLSPPAGKDGLTGDYLAVRRAAGAITSAEWEWFKSDVISNSGKIIIVTTHQAIKDTTGGSGYSEFWQGYYNSISEAESYYTTIPDVDESKREGFIAYIDTTESSAIIDAWLTTNGHLITAWLSGHYHNKIGYAWNGRTWHEERYGIHFINVSGINTKHHIAYANTLESRSCLFQIVGGVMTVKTYIHFDPNGIISKGFYDPLEFKINLKTTFIK